MNGYIGKILDVFLYRDKQLSPASGLLNQQFIPTSPEEWCIYWQEQDQPWRTEPEISLERQQELARCCAIVPDIEKGLYPFGGMRLSRADIEWLLATHEDGRGPVDWSDKSQHEREGLDLRGADLRRLNLSGLPLTRVYARGCHWSYATEDQHEVALVHLSFLDAVLTSIIAFHGRVFAEPFLHPGAPQLWVTAFEAIAGLVVEGVFIAMLTQRFFGK